MRRNRKPQSRAEDASSVIIVPLVNRWLTPPSSGQEAWMTGVWGGLNALRFFMTHCQTRQHISDEKTHNINYNNRMNDKKIPRRADGWFGFQWFFSQVLKFSCPIWTAPETVTRMRISAFHTLKLFLSTLGFTPEKKTVTPWVYLKPKAPSFV